MKIFDRVINLISILLLGFVSVGAILISLRFFPLDKLWTSLNEMPGNWKVLVAGVVFLILTLKLLFSGVYKNREKVILVRYNDLGDVNVSLKAIENLIMRETEMIHGVKSVKVAVFKHRTEGQDVISAKLKVIVDSKVVIPDITNEIQNNILDTVKNLIGIELFGIKVSVENISTNIRSKH
ncbi:alkaline shock response membrane anchor protein AmaP, partial [Selenomonadales bacterium OttesenSCG-928-I06]|nr:alkaline shock response membrane anchor protein AmaP [Selenomonadales bacterium OttesenSCG-928-I06]